MKSEKIVLGLILLIFMNSCGSTIGPFVTNINSGGDNDLNVSSCYITYNNFWLIPILSDIKITNCANTYVRLVTPPNVDRGSQIDKDTPVYYKGSLIDKDESFYWNKDGVFKKDTKK
jgi:hypothetical protein